MMWSGGCTGIGAGSQVACDMALQFIFAIVEFMPPKCSLRGVQERGSGNTINIIRQ